MAKKKLDLPACKSDLAEFVAVNISKILQFLDPRIDQGVFAGSLIVAVNELRGSRDTIDEASVMRSAANAARLGLPPGGSAGLCFLIARRNREFPKKVCTLEIGYKGYLDIAFTNDYLKFVYADVVFEGEEFERWVDETGPKIRHKPNLDRDDLNPAQVRKLYRGAYCIWETTLGGHCNEWVNRKRIEAVDTHENVWKSDPYSMIRKTPVRRASKFWKMTDRLALALRIDGENDEFSDGAAPLDAPVDDGPGFSLNDLEAGEDEND